MKTQKKLKEAPIGRNWHTIDPEPIDFFHDHRVEVEMYPMNGMHAVQITIPELDARLDLYQFQTEEEAVNWARNTYTHYISKLDSIDESRLLERILFRIYSRTL